MKTDQKTALKAPHLQQLLSQVGESLRTHRVAMRLTQDLASNKAEISRQTASRIEQGDPSVSIGQVLRYADVVGATQLFAIPVPDTVSPDQRRVRLSDGERNIASSTLKTDQLPAVLFVDPYSVAKPVAVKSESVQTGLAVAI